MSATVTFWDGDEWQNYVCTLLGFRYGPGNVQRVPAKYKGDLGLDAYIFSAGHAYQCYAPQEPLTPEKRYQKQRDKLTEDINKFIDNKDELTKLLGSLKISRWIFVVPLCDNKELLAHAAGKVETVLKAALPYVTADFRILVEDEMRIPDQFIHPFRRESIHSFRRQAIQCSGAKASTVPAGSHPLLETWRNAG